MLTSVGTKTRDKGASAKNGSIKLVTGNSNPELSEAISAYLNVPMTKAIVRLFGRSWMVCALARSSSINPAGIILSASPPASVTTTTSSRYPSTGMKLGIS